jgi:hypothetical protein
VAQLRMGPGSVKVQCGSVQGAAWLRSVWPGSVRVRRGSVQGAEWLSSGCSVAHLGCGVAQYRVQRGSVEGCGVAQLRMRHGSVDRVRRGSVMVQRDSVQFAA